MTLREVAPGIFVTTSRRDALNSVVVLADTAAAAGDVLLVDPGWERDELDALADSLAQRALRPVAGLATHAHFDHLLWHPRFGDVPRWASAVTTELAIDHREQLLADLGPHYSAEVIESFGLLQALPGTDLPWSGREIELVVHDGHVAGHTAVWIPDYRVLVAGDMLSDVEIPLLDDTPDALDRYREALDALAGYAASACMVIPGHGSIGADAIARLDADRRYLDALASGTRPADARLESPAMAAVHEAQVAALIE